MRERRAGAGSSEDGFREDGIMHNIGHDLVKEHWQSTNGLSTWTEWLDNRALSAECIIRFRDYASFSPFSSMPTEAQRASSISQDGHIHAFLVQAQYVQHGLTLSSELLS